MRINSNQNFPPKPDIAFANIVATPTFSSWSQAYNAGSLFAVLSLSKTITQEELPDDDKRDATLATVGKEVLTALEQEYFILETKDLAHIKQAVESALAKIPEIISFSFIVCSIVKNTAYAYIKGNGKVLLKRRETLGVIISQTDSNDLLSASGFLEDKDLLILQTSAFSKLVSKDLITQALSSSLPSEIAETLSPKIHEKEEGGAAAIFISFSLPSDSPNQPKDELPQEIKTDPTRLSFNFIDSFKKIKLKQAMLFLKNLKTSIPPSKKLFLIIAIIIVIVLTVSIFFSIKKREDEKQNKLFQEVILVAQSKYDEGQNLLSLNKNVARDDFLAAKKVLTQNSTKFPKNSPKEKKILEFIKKIDDSISSASNIYSVTPRQISNEDSLLLATVNEQHALFATEDDSSIYFLNSDGISSLSKKSKKVTLLIKKDTVGKEPIGLGIFYSNLYTLDTLENRILKYIPTGVPAGGTFTKTNYLSKDIAPNFSKAVSLTIDGAVWILYEDGSIQKFLRGNPESFSVTGLDIPFSNPTIILAFPDSGKLYVLDKGNGRIVTLGKDGTYLEQYKAGVLSKADAFEILEKDKKARVLSESKIFEFDLR